MLHFWFFETPLSLAATSPSTTVDDETLLRCWTSWGFGSKLCKTHTEERCLTLETELYVGGSGHTGRHMAVAFAADKVATAPPSFNQTSTVLHCCFLKNSRHCLGLLTIPPPLPNGTLLVCFYFHSSQEIPHIPASPPWSPACGHDGLVLRHDRPFITATLPIVAN